MCFFRIIFLVSSQLLKFREQVLFSHYPLFDLTSRISVYYLLLDKERILILPTLLHPKSRGAVTLRSKDPLEKPVIYPNFLSHPNDVATLIKGKIKSDLKWGIHLRRSLFLYFNYLVSVTACGPESSRGHM